MTIWIPVLIFGTVAGLVLAVFFHSETAYQKTLLLSRLLPLSQGRGDRYSKVAVLRFFYLVGERIVPDQADKRAEVAKKLARAGFKRPNLLEIYYGLRVTCSLILLLVVMAGFGWFRGMSGQTMIMAVGGLGFGYFAPLWLLNHHERQRASKIFRELPDTLDVLIICMNAGLSFDRSLFRVSQELEYIAPTLSKEFERYFFEVESGLPQQEALMNLADRNKVDALTSVTQVLTQSARFGTDITHALRIHADGLRTERRQIAEEKAAKVSTKLVFPTVLFIMPALMLVVLGPASIRLIQRLKFLIW